MLNDPFETERNGFVITTDMTKVDTHWVHRFLSGSTPWAVDIPLSFVERALANSLCFAMLKDGEMVGFARVIADFATFAYLADVLIAEDYRHRGLAFWLIRTIVGHPDLQNLRRFLLATRSAHELYAKVGFMPVAKPETFLEIYEPKIYQRLKSASTIVA